MLNGSFIGLFIGLLSESTNYADCHLTPQNSPSFYEIKTDLPAILKSSSNNVQVLPPDWINADMNAVGKRPPDLVDIWKAWLVFVPAFDGKKALDGSQLHIVESAEMAVQLPLRVD